jgi:hypothetical protein
VKYKKAKGPETIGYEVGPDKKIYHVACWRSEERKMAKEGKKIADTLKAITPIIFWREKEYICSKCKEPLTRPIRKL